MVALALTLGGCVPDSVTLSLGSRDDVLRSSTVITDDGAGKDKVAMIEVEGLIADASQPGLIGSTPSVIDFVVRRLQEAEKDDDVKAVILRINSPGGTVTGSDILYHEIRRFADRTGKPVVASMSEVAASGGYYTALAADEIVAQPTTVTGSIGVIFATFNVSEGMSRIGIHARMITSGPNKDMADPFTPPEESHYEILQGMVDEYYARFRGLVLERRPMIDPDDVDELTDGRVVTGAAAQAYGLVDEVGGVHVAFGRAKALAGVEHARLVRYHAGRHGPKTPYAETAVDAPMAASEEGPSLVRINVGAPFGPTPAAYYLWTPSIR